MVISHKHKFIYIKATKVAGTSTQILLSNSCGKNDVVTPIGSKPQNYYPQNHIGFGSHMTASEIAQRMGDNDFNSYYKFMTVRNPWDRVISEFWWTIGGQGGSNQAFGKFNPAKEIPKGGELIKRFRAWVRGVSIVPLCAWSHIKDTSILDDFIRYENLEKDTLRILNKFGIDAINILYPTEKSKFRISRKHYTEYYDDETRQIVAQKYAKDIEYFGYEFGE